jgi:hypothetical protein
MQFIRPGCDLLKFKANRVKECKFFIAGAKAQKLIVKGCQGYLAYLLNKPKDQCTLEDTTVVKEYQDVFLAKLTSLLPSREVEFTIDLVPRAEPVSRTPYRMASIELKKAEGIVGGTTTAKIHYTLCVTMGSASVICEEEGWHIENVYRL